MKVYKYDEMGHYVGPVECQIDPRASEREKRTVYLMPANSTEKTPLPPRLGFDVVYTNGDWEYKECPKEQTAPEPTEFEKIQSKIEQLKIKLFNTDYVVVKIAEGRATAEDYLDVLNQREDWRQQIRGLEKELKKNEA